MSDSEITTIVSLPALFYQWDGVKRTRKCAYAHYLTFYNDDYSNLPRKIKKRLKSYGVAWVYYDKGRIYTLNPKLLSTPVPKLIHGLFSSPQISFKSERTMVFRRYNLSEATNDRS